MTNPTKTTMEDAKRSRFEKDVPADPTENMSPADAAEWKKQNEENKDNFKAATQTFGRALQARRVVARFGR